jgi:hypothetical protein
MNNLIKIVISVLVVFIGYALPVNAKNTNTSNIRLNNDNFTVEGKEAKFVSYKGEESLLLNDASATLNDISFLNGTIEYDIAFSEKRNFVGVKFRQQDSKNSEEFYIRPHQSGNPDANQYTPVFNGLSAWQLYHKGFSSKVNYNFDDWNHVKIIVSGKQGEVYINDMHKPAFAIAEFLRPIESGSISFSSARADAHIANVSIVKDDKPQTLSTYSKTSKPSADNKRFGYVSKWQISDIFSEKQLAKVTELDQQDIAKVNWHAITADSYGVVNMARVQGVNKSSNSAFAKFTMDSNKTQTKALHFGYSDKVRVFVNNTLVYVGNNSFRSRDYRYLGTIGLYDTVYLPLKAGKNDIIFVVSEQFGGWGVMAKFDDCADIKPCINDIE